MTLEDYERELDLDKIDAPEWLDGRPWTVGEVRDLAHGGCASGCYMPAVTYHEAASAMAAHGDAVLDFLDDCELEIPRGTSWSGFAVFYLSAAVELWACGVLDRITDGEDVYADGTDDE